MFTGIIESTAKILERSDSGIVIERPTAFDDLNIGSSICVSGACLSAVELDDTSMRFDVVSETIKKTTLGMLHKGDSVNLERSLKSSDRFEGHIVQGHTEGTGTVINVSHQDDGSMLEVQIDAELSKIIIPKGSIAIDGVSLTVAEKSGDGFSVALIPHTIENTTLGSLKKGDSVNIETDVLGRYVQSLHHES